MKVILLKDIRGVGKRNTVKEIADGHALNYLIPRGMAEQATPAKLAQLEARMKTGAEVAAQRDKEDKEHITTLASATISLQVKANEQGHLYRQISAETLVDEINKQFGVEVLARAITIKHPIKTVGKSDIEITLGSHKTTMTVDVQAA